MEIQLNGQTTPVNAGITIGDLIREKDLDPATVVVETILKERVRRFEGPRVQVKKQPT